MEKNVCNWQGQLVYEAGYVCELAQSKAMWMLTLSLMLYINPQLAENVTQEGQKNYLQVPHWCLIYLQE